MIPLLSAAFRYLFSILAVVLLALPIAFVVFVNVPTFEGESAENIVAVLGLMVLAEIGIVLALGLIAIQIQNNQHLRAMREAFDKEMARYE